MKATLSDLLQSVRIAKIDTAFVEIGDRAGVRLSSSRNACLHLVLDGQIVLDHGGGGDGSVLLQAGDYAVSLGGKPQILTTGADARVTASDYFMAVHTHDSPPTIRFGTGRSAVRLLSGVFHLPVVNPLVRALPRRMVVRGHQGGGGGSGDEALLLPDVAQAMRRTPAPMVYIDNLGREHSPAGDLSIETRIGLLEHYIGKAVIDAVVVGPKVDVSRVQCKVVVQQPLEADDIPYRHDRALLRAALEEALQAFN